MNLYLRLFLKLLRALGQERLSPQQQGVALHCDSTFRVLPNDIDLFGHMNNGRYSQVFDIARAEWMLRTGVFSAMRRNGWAAVIGGSTVRFRRSLKLFERYEVTTRLISWDRRWFFLEASARNQKGDVVATGICRAALLNRGRWLEADQVMAEVDPDAPCPKLPDYVRDWLKVEGEMSRNVAAPAAANPAVSGRNPLAIATATEQCS